MVEMLASLFGALVGGGFALIGGWLAIGWQAARDARGVASAILAELSVAERLLDEGGVREFYEQMLAHWKETGEVGDRQMLVDMFDSQPQDVLPVYYAMTGKLDLLPRALAAKIVEYHAGIISLPRLVVRFLGKRELGVEAVKMLAGSIEIQFRKTTELRDELLRELSTFAESKRRMVIGSALAPPSPLPSSDRSASTSAGARKL